MEPPIIPSEAVVREQIVAALRAHPELAGMEISVQVVAGQVTLTGNVETFSVEQIALDTVVTCASVRLVVSQLRIGPSAKRIEETPLGV